MILIEVDCRGEDIVQQAVTARTAPRILGARIVKRVESRTGSFLASLENEAQRRLRPILRRLPFGSRREVQRLARRLDRLEHRLGNPRDPSAARMLVSFLVPTDKCVVVPLAEEMRIEQALLQHLTDDEQRALQARFGLGDRMREAPELETRDPPVVRRALKKLWLSSCQADS